jgi:S-adenosylmethionine synthetase
MLEIPDIVRQTIKDIGYTRQSTGSIPRPVRSSLRSIPSRLILPWALTRGAVTRPMFGYACDETPELMPMTIMLAHKLTAAFRSAEERDSSLSEADGKSQVTIEYKDGKLYWLHTIVVSSQHSPDVTLQAAAQRDHREGDPSGAPEETAR